jgi:hypothetical protein
MMTRASINNSREQFEELLSMFTRIRAAWSRVERTVVPSPPTERLRVSSAPASPAPFSPTIPDSSEEPVRPRNSRWSA